MFRSSTVFRGRTRDRTFPRRTLALASSALALTAVTAAGAMTAGPVTAGPVTAGPVTAGPVTSRPAGGPAHPSGVLSVTGRGSGTRGTVALAAFARPLQAADVAAAVPPGRTPRQIAWFMLKSFDWTTREYPYLSRLWARESGWNTYASNLSSGAYGIPQAMPGSKMASAGGDWRTNPRTQIRWGLHYIKVVYGYPYTAWLHELRYGWY